MADSTTCLNQSDNLNGNMSVNISAAALIIVGEPFTIEHKDLIKNKIAKGLQCWSSEKFGCDVYPELQALVDASPQIEKGKNGESHFTHRTDQVQISVAWSPTLETIDSLLHSLLLSGAGQHYVIYAGHHVEGSGAWILQDTLFTAEHLMQIFTEPDFSNGLQKISSVQQALRLSLYGCAGSAWAAAGKNAQLSACGVELTLLSEGDANETVGNDSTFLDFVSHHINVRSTKDLLPSSEVVGNIRFSGPTIYLFPGGQGDCALFGIAGFNLLVNGGYSRLPCFWDFTRHLDRIDAMIQTHIGPDNIFGMSSFIERKAKENVAPELGCVLMNAPPCKPISNDIGDDVINTSDLSLGLKLTEEANKMLQNMNTFKMTPTPCIGLGSSSSIQPMNLYHKVGHGTLDLYILNPPAGGDKELKEFYTQWRKDAPSFTSTKSIPMPNMMSICALLVWKPASDLEQISRILFPGNTPQSKIFEGLNKLKNCNIFQHSQCTNLSLNPPKVTKKPASAPARSAAPAAKPSRSEPARASTTKSSKDEKNNLRKSAATTEKKPASAPLSKTTRTAKSAPTRKPAGQPKAAQSKSATPTKPAPAKTTTKRSAPSATSTPISKSKAATKTPPPSPLDAGNKHETEATPEVVSSEIQKLADTTPSDQLTDVSADDTGITTTSAGDGSEQASELISEAPSEQASEVQSEQASEVQSEQASEVQSEQASEVQSEQASEVHSEQTSELVDLMNGQMSPPPPAADTSVASSNVTSASAIDEPNTVVRNTKQEAEPAIDLLSDVSQPGLDLMDQISAKPEPNDHQLLPEVNQTEQVDLLQSANTGDLLGSHGFDSMSPSNQAEEAAPAPATDGNVDLLADLSSPADPVLQDESPKGLPEPVMPVDVNTQSSDMMASMIGELPAEKQPEQPVEEPPQTDKQKLEAMGIYDEEASNVQDLPQEQPLQPVDLLEQMPPPSSLQQQETSPADVKLTVEEPLPPTEDGGAASESAVFEGVSPEGLPDPQHPGADPTILAEDLELEHNVAVEPKSLSYLAEDMHSPMETKPTEAAPFCVDQVELQLQEEEEDRDHTAGEMTPPDVDAAVHGLSAEQLQEGLTDASDLSVTEDSDHQKDAIHKDSADEVEDVINGNVHADSVEAEPVQEGGKTPEPVEVGDASKEMEPVTDSMENKTVDDDLPKENVDLVEGEVEAGQDIQLEVQPDIQSEIKPEIQPDELAHVESDLQTETKPEVGLDAQHESKPEVDLDIKSKVDSEVQPEAQPEVDLEVQPEIKPEVDLEVKPEVDLDVQLETKHEVIKTETESEVDHEIQPETKPEVDLEVQQETKAELDLEVQPETKHEVDLEVQQETKPEVDLGEQPETIHEVDLGIKTETELEVDHEVTNPEMDPGVQLEAQHEVQEKPQPDTSESEEVVLDRDSLSAMTSSLIVSDMDKDSLSGKDGVMSSSFIDLEDVQMNNGTDPFTIDDGPLSKESKQETNPFVGVSSTEESSKNFDIPQPAAPRDQEEFDPLKSWGQPMDLPAPPPPTADLNTGTSGAQKKTQATKMNGTTTKSATAKSAAAKKGPTKSATAKPPAKVPGKPAAAKKEVNGVSKPSSAPARRPRPSTSAPDANKAAPKRLTTTSKTRSAAGAGSSGPATPVVPFYVDLTYIPAHGNDQYSTIDFFRRVRARYYVLSALNPSVTVLKSFLDGKATWTGEDQEIGVTLIPTYDTTTLRQWMVENQDRLSELKITVSPSASRCSIQLQDHEASCAAYRLEFS